MGGSLPGEEETEASDDIQNEVASVNVQEQSGARLRLFIFKVLMETARTVTYSSTKFKC